MAQLAVTDREVNSIMDIIQQYSLTSKTARKVKKGRQKGKKFCYVNDFLSSMSIQIVQSVHHGPPMKSHTVNWPAGDSPIL